MKSIYLAVALSAAALGLGGCADNPPQPYYGGEANPAPYYQSQAQAPSGATVGYVDRIEVVRKGDSHNIAGTVIGGIVGGLIGHQIGGGSGQTALTIAGAVGGGVAGNQIEQRSRGANETFRVTVRLDNGSYQTVTQDNITDLRTGDRVRVEGDRIYRY
jgi:outer membrane lipoprotein SlyB